MDTGRERQLAAWKGMSPRQRLVLAGRMTDAVLEQRERRLHRRFPGSDRDELRRQRLIEVAVLARLA